MRVDMKVIIKAPYKLIQGSPLSTGWDIRAIEEVTFNPGDRMFVATGVQVKQERITKSKYVYESDEKEFNLDLQVRARSSLWKTGFDWHLGTIDEDFQSEIRLGLSYQGKDPYTIQKGDRIGQLVFAVSLPVEIEYVTVIEEVRGGFGSTGKK